MYATRPGTCKGCQQPFEEGAPIYWSREDGAWHWDCFESQSQPESVIRLAERLKFKKIVEIGKEWDF